MVNSKNRPIRYPNNNIFEYDNKEVFEMVVDLSTNKMQFLVQDSKSLYEIIVKPSKKLVGVDLY